MEIRKTIVALFTVVFVFLIVVDINHEVQAADIAAGLGVAAVPDYEGSNDYDILPFPMMMARWENHRSIKLLGARAQANLIPSATWQGGVVLEFIRERDDVDDSRVKRMRDVDASLMTGGFLGYMYKDWNVSIEGMLDVADGNDGSIIRLNGGYNIPVNDEWRVSLGAFTTWADDDYMEAYFEVDERNSARSGLEQFTADSGFKDIGGIVSVSYSQWERWNVMSMVKYVRLLGDAEDSPVTDDRGSANQITAGFLVSYKFL